MTLPDSQKLEIANLMPGADVIHAGAHRIALGFPEEVIKSWMRARVCPTAWLIPDIRVAAGIVQWALEFPLYYALFVQGTFRDRVKIPVLVHRSDWDAVLTYLRISLCGPTKAEMQQWGVKPEVASMLAGEGEYLALRRPDESLAEVTDMLEPHFFDERGWLEFEGLRVRSYGDNTYSLFMDDARVEGYRLNAESEPEPPYLHPLLPAPAPLSPQPFEVVALGASNGFDGNGPCTSAVVEVHGHTILIDAGPYVRTLLRHAGISPQKLDALVVTHCHEDHVVGLSALLDLNRRIRLFVSRENAAILRMKLAILSPDAPCPEAVLDETFDVVIVEAGPSYDWLGLSLRFHYTMHSVPCTGVELRVRDGAATRSVLFVGDISSRSAIRRAAQQGAICRERFEELEKLYSYQGDLVFADAGSGLIHAEVCDFADNPSTQVVYVHTGELRPGERHAHSLARPGHRYTVVGDRANPTMWERAIAHRALTTAFGGISHDWVDALLGHATPERVNRDHVVIRQGDTPGDVFVVTSGELGVWGVGPHSEWLKVATLQVGEVFGEMAAVRGAARTASVVAESPSIVLRIAGDVFRSFAREACLAESMPDHWQKRCDLERVPLLARASVTSRNLLAAAATRKVAAPGTVLLREGSQSLVVFVLVRGRAHVYRGEKPVLDGGATEMLEPGALLGDVAFASNETWGSSVVTVEEAEYLVIPEAVFREVVKQSPTLSRAMSRSVRGHMAA